MKSTLAYTREPSLGYKVRKLRVSEGLTRQELASLAGVSPREVNLFEHGLPLPLDAKRKMLRELWAKKYGRR